MRNTLAALVALFSLPAFAQEPIDRTDPVVALVAEQTDVLQAMSEKLSRIETLVVDTNQKVATKDDVSALLAKLEAMKLNLRPVVSERVVAVDGVPVVNCVPEIPAASSVACPTYVDDESEVVIDRRFGSDIRVQADELQIERGPLGRLSVSAIDREPGEPSSPSLPSPSLPGCLGGQCFGGNSTAYGSEYNPTQVTTPANDSRRRFRLFPRLFGRRR